MANSVGNLRFLGQKYWDRINSELESQCLDQDEIELVALCARGGALQTCVDSTQIQKGEFYPSEMGTLRMCH